MGSEKRHATDDNADVNLDGTMWKALAEFHKARD